MTIGSVIGMVHAVAEAVRAAGADGVPSGHIYAHLVGRLSLSSYEQVIGTLQGAGLVDKRGDLLVWVGPALGVAS